MESELDDQGKLTVAAVAVTFVFAPAVLCGWSALGLGAGYAVASLAGLDMPTAVAIGVTSCAAVLLFRVRRSLGKASAVANEIAEAREACDRA